MKLQVDRDVLAEAVTWAVRGLSARPAVPVLAGVLLDAAPDGLPLSSFDYEVSAKVTVDAQVDEPGTVLVHGRLLGDISRALPSGRAVDITSDGTKVQVLCASSRFSLQQMPTTDYPTLPATPRATGTVSGEAFTKAVSQVSIAADRGDTLPILTGVRLEIDGDKLSLLATDRYRLALRELTWNPAASDAAHVALIPARTLAETAKSLGAAASVELALGSAAGGEGLAGFEAGRRRTTTRLLDGDYPKVTSIFPTSVDTVSLIKTSELTEAVKRVSLVAERNTPVRLRFTEGQVSIEAGQGDEAQASEAVEATLTGPDLEIAFNPQFLLDGLGALGTTYARLAFTQPSRPAVLSGQDDLDGESDESYRYVLMPVRFAS